MTVTPEIARMLPAAEGKSTITRVSHGAPGNARISVLVREKDELVAVQAFWAAMARQTCFAQAEIIFLDGGSTDGTLEYLRDKACDVYTLQGHFNYGRSCNHLAEVAAAPYLLYLSGHVLLEQPDALERILEAMAANPEAALYLRQVPNTVLGFNAYDVAHLNRRFPAGDALVAKTEAGGFSNAASVLPWKAWQQRPFHEVHGSEDFLWAKEHLAAGGQMFYMPQVHAMHSHAESARQIHDRVRLSAVTLGLTRSYAKAAYMVLGVYVSMRRVGARHREAMKFAWAHGSAYL